jgi:hypothetical protein
MKLLFKSQVARWTLRMLYGPFERAQFYTPGLDGRPRAHYASVSDYQRVMLFAHIARNHYGALALMRLTSRLACKSPQSLWKGPIGSGIIATHVQTRRTISPAHARAPRRAPAAQRRPAQDAGIDGVRAWPSFDRGRRTVGSGARGAHRAATP